MLRHWPGFSKWIFEVGWDGSWAGGFFDGFFCDGWRFDGNFRVVDSDDLAASNGQVGDGEAFHQAGLDIQLLNQEVFGVNNVIFDAAQAMPVVVDDVDAVEDEAKIYDFV